jgi:hypothetical protein
VVGGDVHAVEAQAELTDDGVVEELDGGRMEANIVDRPVGAERLALGRELADEVRQLTVVRVAPGSRTQDLGGGPGGSVPVGVEGLGARVEEAEPREVRRAGRCGVQLGEQRSPERVGGEMSRRSLPT